MPRTVVLALLVGLLPLAGMQSGGGGDASPEETWDTRLERLRPDRPLEYFELAEEVADRAEDDADRRLAQHLFSLAGALDPDQLGRSACLALADMETRPYVKQRLLALATLLGDAGLMGGAAGQPTPPPTATAVQAVTEAFSHYRRGKGARALNALEKPGAMELLTVHAGFLRGGVPRFVENCRLYRGQLRPSLTEDDLTLMLRLEVALLAGSERPWSAELRIGGGEPLVEVDPEQLAATLGVDPALAIFREGRWRREVDE